MSNNKNIYLVIFGANGFPNDFSLSRIRLEKEARDTGWFTDVFNYSADDLISYNKKLTGVGAGYYWWKSVVCQISLNKIKKNDIILYLDAGCSINIKAEKRFWEYIQLCDDGPGFVGFGCIGENPPIEKTYTKRDLLIHLKCDLPKYTETTQAVAGLFFVKNNQFGNHLINEWVELSMNEHLIGDYISINPEYSEYKAHRHDQSILSLLLKLRLPKLNNYLLNSLEVATTLIEPFCSECPLKATRINDSHL